MKIDREINKVFKREKSVFLKKGKKEKKSKLDLDAENIAKKSLALAGGAVLLSTGAKLVGDIANG